MSKKKLYGISLLCLVAGYTYLAYSLSHYQEVYNSSHTLCLFKTITGVPCPSCGSTRTAVSLLHGDLSSAFYWNPLGILSLLIMLIAPVLIFYDLLGSKSTFFNAYQQMESFFRRKPVMYMAIALLLINWIWNINKGL